MGTTRLTWDREMEKQLINGALQSQAHLVIKHLLSAYPVRQGACSKEHQPCHGK